MKVNKLYSIIFFLFLLISCDENKNKELFKNSDVAVKLDEYIQQNPLKLPTKADLSEYGFSYPSYQLYFDRMEEDTVMYIIQVAFYNDGKPYTLKKEGEDFSIDVTEPKGSFLYKGEYPITIFDENSLGNKNIYNENFLNPVPDSLKFKEQNVHLKPKMKKYRLKEGKIITE